LSIGIVIEVAREMLFLYIAINEDKLCLEKDRFCNISISVY